VQNLLDAAGTAYQKPASGIPLTDLAASVQAAINAAAGQQEAINNLQNTLTGHVGNSTIHVTSQDKTNWNGKATPAEVAAAIAAALADYDTEAEVAAAIAAALTSYYTKAQTYTKTEVDNLLSPKQTAAQVQAIVASALASYSTTAEVATAITNALAAYYTKTAIDGIVAGLQSKLTFDQTPTLNSSNPVTSEGIRAAIANAVNGLVNSTYVQNAISTALANYSTTSQISAMITTALTTTLANYYTKAETDTKIQSIVGTIQAQAAGAAASAEAAEEKAGDAAASAAAANQKLVDLETYLGTLDPESAASVAAALGLLTEEVHTNYARKDGMYEDMTVGNAKNILSEDVVTEQTTLGVTAPDAEIGNGTANLQTIEGDGVAWSQLYDKNAGGSSVATEQGQLEFLFGKVVERFSNSEGTTPMGSLFLREFLTGADLTGRVAVTGEGFVPAVTEENQSNYTGLHYKVKATHAEAVQRSGEEGSYSYSSAFFVGGANFSASDKRNVIDMALAFGIERYPDNSEGSYMLDRASAPSTLAQMYGWLGSKVGLSDDYDYNGGELIGVRVLQLRSMPGVNLLDPTSGVALCPYYEWENADGLYRVVARNGAVISGVVATALGGQPVAVVEVTAGSVYEVSVPEGDAVVMQVTLSSGSLADCAAWQVWDDSTPSDEVGGYSRSVLELPITRLVGQKDGTGSFVRFAKDGLKDTFYHNFKDILDTDNNQATVKVIGLAGSSLSFQNGGTNLFRTSVLDGVKSFSGWSGNMLMNAGYMSRCNVGFYWDKMYGTINSQIWVKDVSCANVAAFDAIKSGFKFWVALATPKTFTNLYLLPADAEGDTFAELPAGSVPLSTYFPGTYQVGNTGVTMQTANWDDQTQRFAATPQSAAAKTSSVMPGNYVELLRSLQQMSILDGWVSPDQMHAHQSATVQALNAMATANQLSGQFTLTDDDDVAYSNE
jgi:hypothetical protein